MMKQMRVPGLILCGMALVLTACHQTARPDADVTTPAPVTQPATATLPAIPAPRAVDENATSPAPAVPGASAAATRADALKVVPAAPGLRVSRVHVPGMYVALTFDDGPAAATTPKVLDILKRNNAVGTFFVLGQNASVNRSLVARAAAEGNEIGVHTWSHIKMTGSSLAKVDSEISRTASVIQEITGRAPLVMRPPYGATNGGLVNRMKAQFGMRSILWDVDTLDWKHPGVQKVINTAVGQAKPGSIILVHDIHASTVAAIEGIVQGLQARGFKLVTVSQLISLANRAAGQSADAAPAAAPVPAPAAPVADPAAPETPTVTPAEAPSAPAVTPAQPAEQPAPAPAVDEWLNAPVAPAAPAAIPAPQPSIRPAAESGAASISATTDAAAEEVAPAAEPAVAPVPAAPAAPEGAAGISGQELSL